MKNKFIALTVLLIALFVLNSCELLNPLLGDNTNEPILKSDITISIERSFNSIQGQHQAIEITMQNTDVPIGGLNLLITYDPSALVFQSADPGNFITDCGWRYFTFRHAIIIIDSIPIATVRITSLANVGYIRPTCYIPSDSTSNQLAVLNFLVTNDRAFECEFAPVQFFWIDCFDNALADVSGNQLIVSNNIYNMTDTNKIDYYNNLASQEPYPSIAGYNNSCDTLIPDYERKPLPLRNIDFINGGIDIVCADSIDMRGCARGDINLNSFQDEIADIILFSNYFIYGLLVFTADSACQIATTDTNADGLTLTVSDLVYQIRVLVGDAQPYPNNAVNDQTFVTGQYQHNDAGVISVSDNLRIAAAHIVVQGDITPTLLAENMTMISNFDGTNTSILVYSLENNNFTGDMINIGNNTIVSLELADQLGNQLIVTPLD